MSRSEFLSDVESADVGQRAAKGSIIMVGASILRLVLTLGSVAIMARLLTPSDYGLAAMVWPLILLLTWIGDMGLTMATIQRKDLDPDQVSTFFWINLGISIVMSLLALAAAPLAGWFYDEPRVVGIAMVLALCFPLNALQGQHKALLRRLMRMKHFAFVDVTATASGVTAGITAAAYGLSYWALVILPVTQYTVGAILYWLTVRWVPGPPRWRADMMQSFTFGLNLTGSTMLGFLMRQVDNVLIGWKYDEKELGPYSFAYRMVMLPKVFLIDQVGHAIIPALSRLQDERERFERYFLMVVGVLAYVLWPVLAAASIMSDTLILAYAGPQWSAAAEIFSVLAIMSMVSILVETANFVYFSTGRSDRQLRWMLVLTPMAIVSFVIGLPYGAYGVAVGITTVYTLMFLPGLAYAFYGSPISFRAFIHAMTPVVIVTLSVSCAFLAYRALRPDMHVLLDLALCGLLGASVFVLVTGTLFGFRSAPARVNALRDLLKGKTSAIDEAAPLDGAGTKDETGSVPASPDGASKPASQS